MFLAAARVGGIHANNIYPVDFLMSNLLIEANICRAAHRAQVKRLIFLGSSCIYPRDCPQPIREEYLLTGPLEATNRPYALAKIAGIEMCWSYNRQYGTKWLCRDADQSVRPGRQLRPEQFPCAARADPQDARSETVRRGRGGIVGQRQTEARIPVCRRSGERAGVSRHAG